MAFSSMSFEKSVQAYKEEPYMPPEDEIRAWILIFYTEKTNLAPAKFWTDYGHKMYAASKTSMKPNEDIKRESARITGDATILARKTPPSVRLLPEQDQKQQHHRSERDERKSR